MRTLKATAALPTVQLNMFVGLSTAQEKAMNNPAKVDALFTRHLNTDWVKEVGTLDDWLRTPLTQLITRWSDLYDTHVQPFDHIVADAETTLKAAKLPGEAVMWKKLKDRHQQQRAAIYSLLYGYYCGLMADIDELLRAKVEALGVDAEDMEAFDETVSELFDRPGPQELKMTIDELIDQIVSTYKVQEGQLA